MTELKTPTESIRGIQVAIYKHGQRFECGKTKNKSSKWSERDPTLGSLDCVSNALISRPCCPPQLPSQGKLYLSSLLQNLELLWLCWHLLTCTAKVLLCASFSEDLKLRSSFDTNDLSYYFQSITQVSSIILLFEDNQYYSWMALEHNTRYSIISFFFCLQTNKNRAGRIQ